MNVETRRFARNSRTSAGLLGAPLLTALLVAVMPLAHGEDYTPSPEHLQAAAERELALTQGSSRTIIEIAPGQTLRAKDHPEAKAMFVLEETTAFDPRVCEPMVLPTGRRILPDEDLSASGLTVTGARPLRLVVIGR